MKKLDIRVRGLGAEARVFIFLGAELIWEGPMSEFSYALGPAKEAV